MDNIKQINIDWTKIKSLISARIDVRIHGESDSSLHCIYAFQ